MEKLILEVSPEVKERIDRILVSEKAQPPEGADSSVPAFHALLCLTVAQASSAYLEDHQAEEIGAILEDADFLIRTMKPLFERTIH